MNIIENIYNSIQDKLIEEIDKKADELIEQFTQEINKQKFMLVSDVMKNVIIELNNGIELNEANISISFKNKGD